MICALTTTISASFLDKLGLVGKLPSFPKLSPIEIERPRYGGHIKLGDGDLVGHGGLYVYKCKICDMPRLFKMNHGSSVGR